MSREREQAIADKMHDDEFSIAALETQLADATAEVERLRGFCEAVLPPSPSDAKIRHVYDADLGNFVRQLHKKDKQAMQALCDAAVVWRAAVDSGAGCVTEEQALEEAADDYLAAKEKPDGD